MIKIIISLLLMFLLNACGDKPHNAMANKLKLSSISVNDVTCNDCVSVYFEKTYLMVIFEQPVDNCNGVFNIVLNTDLILPGLNQTVDNTLMNPLESSGLCNIATDTIYISNENNNYMFLIGSMKIILKENSL